MESSSAWSVFFLLWARHSYAVDHLCPAPPWPGDCIGREFMSGGKETPRQHPLYHQNVLSRVGFQRMDRGTCYLSNATLGVLRYHCRSCAPLWLQNKSQDYRYRRNDCSLMHCMVLASLKNAKPFLGMSSILPFSLPSSA